MILDTNALSALVDGEAAIRPHLSGADRVAIPVIVLGEFRYGIAQSRHWKTYDAWLNEYLADFEILPITDATATSYVQVRLALKKAGTPIPANDAWIAALALEHRLAVLTRDQHFDAVPGLQRREW